MTDEPSQSRHTGSGRSAQKAQTETRRIAKKALRRSDKHELGKLTGPIEPERSDEQSDPFFWQKKPEDETP